MRRRKKNAVENQVVGCYCASFILACGVLEMHVLVPTREGRREDGSLSKIIVSIRQCCRTPLDIWRIGMPDILPPGLNSPFYSARWRNSSAVFYHVRNHSSSSYNRTTLPVTTPLWQQQQICSSRAEDKTRTSKKRLRRCERLHNLG